MDFNVQFTAQTHVKMWDEEDKEEDWEEEKLTMKKKKDDIQITDFTEVNHLACK